MKRLSFLMIAVIAALTTFAQGAKRVEDLRIYVNPGHGAWGSNDRPLTVIYENPDGTIITHNPGTSEDVNQYPDTLGFYESNTNLWKCLALVDYLEAAGLKFDRTLNQGNTTQGSEGPGRDMRNNIVMSRTKNGPYPCTANTDAKGGTGSQYNRSLTEIAAEVNSNHFDLFLAVHSNGGGTYTNYLLYLYRGYDNATTTISSGLTKTHQQISRKFATLLEQYTINFPYQTWTEGPYVRGDIDFYKAGTVTSNGATGYLGALRHLVPGALTEGYFHTYMPSRHRAMNPEVDRIEGQMYARAIFDYFGIPFSGKGNIYGIVRAKGVTFTHTYYKPKSGTTDVYRPINHAHVDLYKGEQKIGEYDTDGYFNGAFLFFDLEPGDYRIVVSARGYKPFTQEVAVVADQESLPEVFLTADSTSGGTAGVYSDPAGDAGVEASSSYALTQEYIDEEIPALAQCATIKRVIAANNYVYILGLKSDNTPVLVKYDHVNRTATPLSTQGCSGTYMALSDIAVTSDGYLVGINSGQQDLNSTTGSHTSAETYIYKWAKAADGSAAESAPTKWLSASSSAYFYNVQTGKSMAYAGSTASGYVYYTAHNDYASDSDALRIIRLKVTNNAVTQTWSDRLNTVSGYLPSAFGEVRLDASPTSGNYFLSGSIHQTVEFAFPSSDNVAPTVVGAAGSFVPSGVRQSQVFAYGGKKYMAVPMANGTYTNGVKLVELTSNISTASTVSTTGNTITTNATTYPMSTSAAAGTTLADDNITNATFQLALFELRGGNRLSKFTAPAVSVTINVEEGDPVIPDNPVGHGSTPARRAPLPYGLSLEGDAANGYTASFTLTEDVEALEIVATPIEGSDDNRAECIVAEMDAMGKGSHTVDLDISGLRPGCSYNWSVRVMGPEGRPGKVYQHNHPDHRTNSGNTIDGGGVAVINDPEAEHFGWSGYSNNYGNGLMFFDQNLEPIRKQPSPYDYAATRATFYRQTLTSAESASVLKYKFKSFRMAADGDDFYVCDFNDPSSQIWRITPDTYANAASAANFTSVYPSGATMSNNGYWNYGGVQVGSGCSSFGFTGMGVDRKLWMFAEDFSPSNVVVYFNIGESKVNTSAATIPNTAIKNAGYTAMSPYKNGMWLCLNTTNETNKPAFVYMLEDGTVAYSSYNSRAELNSLTQTECTIAMNPAGTMLAVGVPDEGIRIYDVTWYGTTPSLKYKMIVKDSNNFDGTTLAMKDSSYAGGQLAWDSADNVYAFQISPAAGNAGMNVYSLGLDNPVITTPAPKASLIVAAAPTVLEPVEAPVFYVNGEEMVDDDMESNEVVTVTLATATPGASIYYWSEELGAEDVLYTGPITVDRSAIIEAYASKEGMENSVSTVKMFTLVLTTPPPTADRGVFAYDLRMNKVSLPQSASRRAQSITGEDDYRLSYKLTGDVLSARVNLIDITDPDNVWKSVEAGTSEGENTVDISASELAPGHIYLWELEYETMAVEESGCLGRLVASAKADACGGIARMRNPESPYYGYFAVSEGFNKGLRLFTPAFTDMGFEQQPTGSHWDASKRYSPGRVYAEGLDFYVADWSDPGSDIYFWNLETPNQIASTYDMDVLSFNSSNGEYYVVASGTKNVWAGSNTSLVFTGEGQDRKVWAFMEDVKNPVDNTTSGILCRFDYPEGGLISSAPTFVNTNLSASETFSNLEVEMVKAHGGIFMSERRAAAASHPSLIYIDLNGNILYNSNVDQPELNTCGRGIAVNDEETMIAVSRTQGSIDIFDLAWANDGKPQLTYRCTVSNGDTSSDEVSQMAFDAGGNLYAWHRSSSTSKGGLYMYAIAGDIATHIIAAPSQQELAVAEAEAEGTDRFGVYAYDLTCSGARSSGYTLKFKLNGPAKNVDVRLKNVETGRYLDEVNGTKWSFPGNYGDNTVFIEPSYLESEGAYNWEIDVYNLPITESELLLNNDPMAVDAAGGVLVIRDHNSPAYGHVVTSTGRATGFNTYTPTFYEFDGETLIPSLQPDGSAPYAVHSDWKADHRYSPCRIAEVDGMVVAVDWADASANLYTFNPLTNDPIGSMYPLGASRNSSTGLWTYGTTRLGGSATAVAFTGSSDDTYMWTFDEDVLGKHSLLGYHLGQSRTVENAPFTLREDDKLTDTGYMKNTDVCIEATSHGLFLGQVRATGMNSSATPGFIFVDFEGNVLFNSGESLPGDLDSSDDVNHLKACGSAIAVNRDETLLAVAEGYHGIKVFDLSWNGNTPVLSNMRMLPASSQSFDKSAIRIPQMAFDPAGNLYVFYFTNMYYTSSDEAGVHLFSVKRTAAGGAHAPRRAPSTFVVDPNEYVVTTKAADNQILRGNNNTTGEIEVNVEEITPDEVYYNLQGMRIDTRRIAPGIYIRVTVDRTEKVVVH